MRTIQKAELGFNGVDKHTTTRRNQYITKEERNGKTVYTLVSDCMTSDGVRYSVKKEMNEQEIKERQNYNGGVLEVEDNEYINTPTQKPTEANIKKLREIKAVRRTQKLEGEVKPSHPLSESLKGITAKRGKNREQLLKEIAYKFCDLHKDRGVTTITTQDINDLCSCITAHATRERLRSLLIKLLVKDGKIVKRRFDKTFYHFQLRNLITYDGESWSVLKKKKYCVCGGNMSVLRSNFKRKVIVFDII